MAKQVYTTGQILTAAQMTTLQANDYNQTVSAKVASYTLVAADAGTRITMSNASATTITVNTSIFTAGDTLEITNIGAGVLTVTAGTATVSTSSTLALNQFDSGQLYFTSTGVAIFFASDAADSPLTTKGDIFTFSTTNDRLAVGNSGETLVADASTSTGLRYQGLMAAGKNAIINGAYQVWQRGTSFTSNSSTSNYTSDRWIGQSNATTTFSRQLTNDTTNLPFIQYCIRAQRNTGATGTDFINIAYSLETADSIPFAGKTITISFYARKGANFSDGTAALIFQLLSGTGTDQNSLVGYTGAAVVASVSPTLTTTWQRFSATGTVAATATEIGINAYHRGAGTAGAADFYELTGVQVELGSVATSFDTATGTIQGELAACQRYYYRNQMDASSRMFGNGWNGTTTVHYAFVSYPVTMRIRPTALEQSGTAGHYQVAHANTVTVCSAIPTFGSDTTEKGGAVALTVASGLTAGQGAAAYSANAAAFFGWSAEL